MKRAATAAVAAFALAGCGGSGGGDKHPQLIVTAASSLRNAFTDYATQFKSAKVRLSFGGSDELAAQIRAGSGGDVFAAANTKLPDALYAEGKVGKPVKFTANRLVLAVPSDDARVKSLDDLVKPGVKIAIGSPSVPIGSYTRHVLGGLPSMERNRILANVKSQEPDVAGIVGKLTQGAVDAGFVYVTDVQAARGRLHAYTLPGQLRPVVAYEAAVVKSTKHRAAANAFIAGLVKGAGRAALHRAGFMALPR